MSSQTQAIVDGLNTLETGLKGIREGLIEKVPQPNNSLPAEQTLSNTDILIETLRKFFSDDDSSYIPVAITKQVTELVAAAVRLSGEFQAAADEQVPLKGNELLETLDKLYAHALAHGFLSYSLIANNADQIFNRLRGYVGNAAKLVKDVTAQLDTVLTDSRKTIEEGTKGAITVAEEAKKSVSDTVEEITQLHDSADNAAKALELIKTESEALKTTLAELSASTSKDVTALIEDVTKKKDALETVNTEADETLTATKALEKQAQESAAEAKASSTRATEALAQAQQDQKDLKQFYTDLETHKSTFSEVSKKAQADAVALKDDMDRRIAEYSTKTEAIINSNLEVERTIRQHLEKAVGIPLFKAFDVRREQLAKSTEKWGKILAGAVGALIVFGIVYIALETGDLGARHIYTRLAVAVPLSFLVVFAAFQYGKERRAEEEYAFKGAISVSLESYKDLLERMHAKGAETEAAFIKQLVSEVFDNPVKRLYYDKEGKPLPDNMVSDLADRVGKLLEKRGE